MMPPCWCCCWFLQVSSRGEVLKQLSTTRFLAPSSPAVYHGRLYRGLPPAPNTVSINRLEYRVLEFWNLYCTYFCIPLLQEQVVKLRNFIGNSCKTHLPCRCGRARSGLAATRRPLRRPGWRLRSTRTRPPSWPTRWRGWPRCSSCPRLGFQSSDLTTWWIIYQFISLNLEQCMYSNPFSPNVQLWQFVFDVRYYDDTMYYYIFSVQNRLY